VEGYDGGVMGHAGASGDSGFRSDLGGWELNALGVLLGVCLDGLLEF